MTTAPTRFWLSSLTGLAVVGLCTGGVLLSQQSEAGPGAPTLSSKGAGFTDSSAESATVAALSEVAAVTSAFRNGEYAAAGSYLTPGGNESIAVKLVVTHGLVTDAVVHTEALSPTARQFQVQFQSAITATVVGRELAGLSVDRVAGASLTSVGFNDALTQIRTEAKT